MHPEVITDHPGNCPKCGMKLVPMKEKKRSTPNSDKSRAGTQRSTSNDQSHHAIAFDTRNASIRLRTSGHEMQMEMHSSIDLADPMSREGSGTSWLPDSSPMYGRMFMFGDDMLMLHGAIFPRYTNVSTRRGDDRIDAPNWFMAMYSHPLGDSAQFGARLMMSLDPLTEGGRGYPLLFQTGESWNGQPLHDRQHPHDLFDELSFSLRRNSITISAPISISVIRANRRSVRRRSCIAHRPWMIPTRRSAITGRIQRTSLSGWPRRVWSGATMKIEGSIFTGREPDEDRYDFDRPRFRFVQRPPLLEPDAKSGAASFIRLHQEPRSARARAETASHNCIAHLQPAARTR